LKVRLIKRKGKGVAGRNSRAMSTTEGKQVPTDAHHWSTGDHGRRQGPLTLNRREMATWGEIKKREKNPQELDHGPNLGPAHRTKGKEHCKRTRTTSESQEIAPGEKRGP